MLLSAFAGKNITPDFIKTVKEVLSKYVDFESLSENEVSLKNDTSQMLVLFLKNAQNLDVPYGISVMCGCNEDIKINSKTVLFLSDNKTDLKVVSKLNQNVIDLGFGRFDSITFSSINGEGAVICVQRAVKRLDGSIIEPCEIPITVNANQNRFALLSAYTILLLCNFI